MKNFIRKSCLLLLLVTLVLIGTEKSANAQIYTGGTTGVSYNNGYVVELAPLIGYKYQIFSSGFSPFFSYLESQKKYSFGGRAFSDITFYKDIFAHAEIEVSNVEKIRNNIKTREWILAMPLGGGYKYKISDGVYAYGMILYNVLQTSDSQTKNPIIRGGITYQP